MMHKKRIFWIVVDCLQMGIKLGDIKHCDIWKIVLCSFNSFEQCICTAVLIFVDYKKMYDKIVNFLWRFNNKDGPKY